MKSNAVLVENLTVEQLQSFFDSVNKRFTQLEEKFQPKQPAEYMTRSEVAKFFRVDLSTLHNWVKKGKLKSYGIGNRVYFLRSEIESVLIPLNQKAA